MKANAARSALVALLAVAVVVGPGAIAFALWSTSATGTLTVSVASASSSAGVTPNAPTGLRCAGSTTDGKNNPKTLSWTVRWSATTGVNQYVVYRLPSPYTGAPQVHATVPAGPASPSANVTVGVLDNNVPYRFNVAAKTGALESVSSNSIWLKDVGGDLSCFAAAP